MIPPVISRPPQFGSYRSANLDEVRSFYADECDTRMSVGTSARDAASFAITVDHVQVGPLRVIEDWQTADTILHCEQDEYVVAVAGQVAFEQRGTRNTTTPTGAVVYSPAAGPLVSWIGAHHRASSVTIHQWALAAQLEALLDRPVRAAVRLAPDLDLATAAGRTWRRLFELFASGVRDRDSAIYQPLVAEPLCHALLTGLLLAADHPDRESLAHPAPPARPRAVKHAIDAMQAHPERPLTTAALAGLTGVSVRTLHEGFRRYVGISPMGYLSQVRLARAHEDLRAGRARTVAEVARRWGFTHLGRFAATYRARYGVMPSTTLHLG